MSPERSGLRWAPYESPIGRLTLVGAPDAAVVLRRLLFPGHPHGLPPGAEDASALAPAAAVLDAYFAGRGRDLAVPVALDGTPFQRAVWALLRDVPYGGTTSYGALALRVAQGRAAPGEEPATTAGIAARLTRAVAAAVARTPVPIVVPCHRVIGADGALTGYLGGLDRKRALLALERAGDPEALRRSWAQRQLTLL
jgi:methylated-DNA-[protein]-cysteine S-methyltransferase